MYGLNMVSSATPPWSGTAGSRRAGRGLLGPRVGRAHRARLVQGGALLHEPAAHPRRQPDLAARGTRDLRLPEGAWPVRGRGRAAARQGVRRRASSSGRPPAGSTSSNLARAEPTAAMGRHRTPRKTRPRSSPRRHRRPTELDLVAHRARLELNRAVSARASSCAVISDFLRAMEQLFLKQFRDAALQDQPAYQAVIEAPAEEHGRYKFERSLQLEIRAPSASQATRWRSARSSERPGISERLTDFDVRRVRPGGVVAP